MGKYKMPQIDPVSVDNNEYWKRHAENPPLPKMKSRCHDCAISTGFYIPIADELLEQPLEIQQAAVRSWYCHNHSGRACKGAEEYVIEGLR